MSGSYIQSSNGTTILKSLTFETNVATYGPYGLSKTSGDTCFQTPLNIGKIVGFYGTKNILDGSVESIGAYFAPVYHRSPLEKIGPFGDYFLNTWDDGKHKGVKQIVLRYGLVIDGIQFTYVDSSGHAVEGNFHGTPQANEQVSPHPLLCRSIILSSSVVCFVLWSYVFRCLSLMIQLNTWLECLDLLDC